MSIHQPPDLWSLLGALVISAVSGIISISRRVTNGHKVTWLWLISEYLTAILCGYLAYHAYPTVADSMPTWATLPLVVAIAAHSGGRIFQELEAVLLERAAPFFRGSNQ